MPGHLGQHCTGWNTDGNFVFGGRMAKLPGGRHKACAIEGQDHRACQERRHTPPSQSERCERVFQKLFPHAALAHLTLSGKEAGDEQHPNRAQKPGIYRLFATSASLAPHFASSLFRLHGRKTSMIGPYSQPVNLFSNFLWVARVCRGSSGSLCETFPQSGKSYNNVRGLFL